MSCFISSVFTQVIRVVFHQTDNIKTCASIERKRLQQKGYDLLNQQYECKRAELVSIRADIDQLSERMARQNLPVRSQHDIEQIENEIRDLVNENAKLETKISQSELSNINIRKTN